MGLFSRDKAPRVGNPGPADAKSAQAATVAHFAEFVAARSECEAFIEPATHATQTTMVIVAGTGEWTRRRVPDAKTAAQLAAKLGVPCYDVNLSGYPSRMREWNEKQHKGRS